jgi:hypothetical protein
MTQKQIPLARQGKPDAIHDITEVRTPQTTSPPVQIQVTTRSHNEKVI